MGTTTQDVSLLKALSSIGAIVFILYIVTGTGFSLGAIGLSSLPWWVWVAIILIFLLWLRRK